MSIWAKFIEADFGWRPCNLVMVCDQCRKHVRLKHDRNGPEIEEIYETEGAHLGFIDGRDLCGDCKVEIEATLPPKHAEAEDAPSVLEQGPTSDNRRSRK